MTTCFIYSRVSSSKQTEYNKGSTSMESQIANCKNYADSNNITINSIYTDVCSGRTTNRPGFKRMIRKVNQVKPDFILINDISRFSRNTKEGLTFLDKLLEKGCIVNSITNKTKYETQGEKRIFRYFLNQAEDESIAISERVKNSIRFRKERGDYFGRAPYGYKIVRKTNGGIGLQPNPEEQKIITEINDNKDKGLSSAKIADTLNKICRKRGRDWTKSSVSYVHRKSNMTMNKFQKDMVNSLPNNEPANKKRRVV